jgi:hypothetical protein
VTPSESVIDGLPEVEVWAFGRWRRDHLALVDADATLCGCRVNPHGFPTLGDFDPAVGCRRCLRSVKKLGRCRVRFRSHLYGPRVVTLA